MAHMSELAFIHDGMFMSVTLTVLCVSISQKTKLSKKLSWNTGLLAEALSPEHSAVRDEKDNQNEDTAFSSHITIYRRSF